MTDAPPSVAHPRIEPSDACSVVLFGATGDLAAKKIFPALAHLIGQPGSEARFDVLGVGRTRQDEATFRASVKKSLEEPGVKLAPERVAKFLERVGYVEGDPAKPATYDELRKRLDALPGKNRLFYAATPAEVFPAIIEQLAAARLLDEKDGWSRLVIEKPFGLDVPSARELNQLVARSAQESQIFRIDHFIGKSTVQNILFLRFANRLFETLWNRESVDWVEISAAETLGVGDRAGFYDATGALRDMLVNHLMQLLCVTTMEAPDNESPEAFRDRKVELLKSVRAIRTEDVPELTARGRYTAGSVDGQDSPDYTSEHGVKEGSITETFAAIKLFVDNDRWKGVPFYMRSGKRLAAKQNELVLHLRPTATKLFGHESTPNVILVKIAPDEGLTITFTAKRPDSETATESVHLDFLYKQQFDAVAPDSYETLLVDVMRGHPTLFMRHDEVELAWGIIQPILDAWKDPSTPPLETYVSGTEGPASAAKLLAADGHAWRPLQKKS